MNAKLYEDIANYTNQDFRDAEHVFYNAEENQMQGIKYAPGLGMYEIWTYDDEKCMSHGFAGVLNIMAKHKLGAGWEYIGVL